MTARPHWERENAGRKNDLRIDAYGTVDETNAVVGLVRLHTAGRPHRKLSDDVLGRIQNDLFDLGADLATPETDQDLGYEPLRISEAQVSAIETAIDASERRSFTLAFVRLAGGERGIGLPSSGPDRVPACRAADGGTRFGAEKINPAAVRYMNRLSDYFFVASRYLNEKGEKDVLWVPGQNR